MVNSTAEVRRHAAAVKIGFVYDLEYAAKPWFGFAGCEKSSDIHERELFLSVTRISRSFSYKTWVSVSSLQEGFGLRTSQVALR
jgi:hypothetical protein